MNERAMHIDQIRERVERDDYDVDPAAVAAAIVARCAAAGGRAAPSMSTARPDAGVDAPG